MGVQVRFSPGHDIYYLPGRARPGGGGERTAGGYYVNAAIGGEPPGRWFGKGAAALGLDEGDEVDPAVHEQVFSQVDPRTGGRIGRGPSRDTAEKRAAREAELARLLAAEPHATAARRHELERQAAQMHRVSRPYTDFTVAYSKSVSVVHASIRENARRAALAGDVAAEAYWADMEARFAGILFDGATVAMRHLERWATTRAGFGRQVDDEQYGRYEPAGLTVSMWLQGTSRDGDPHDHVHCAVARMCLTLSDGRWRAHDTMTLRRQGGTAKLLASAYHLSAFTGALRLRWRPGVDGNEVQGVAQAHMDAYSSRAQQVTRETARRCAAFARMYGREPNRAEVRRIAEAARVQTRKGKDDTPIDWDELAARWDATLGGDLAQIAIDLGLGPGDGAGTGQDSPDPAGPGPGEQLAAMGAALARVQAKYSAWTRGELCGALADVLPPSMAGMAPQAAMALALEMANRIINGEVQPVACLDAPEPRNARTPPALRRDLDGRSVFVRPGVSRYATEVQLSREEQLLERARQDGAPRLTRARVARLLGADPARLDAQLRESVRAQESRALQPSGLSAAQQAAVYHLLTSPRRCEVIEAPAGAGKTRVLAAAARICRDAGVPVYGLGASQQSVHVLQAAAAAEGVDLAAWNTARFLGQRKDGTYRGGPEIRPGAVLLVDEGSMVSMEHYRRVMALAARVNVKVITAGDREQLTAVEGGGGFAFLADELGVVQLPDPVRFSHPWEQAASLRLHAGDAEVLTEYADQGRITGAPPEQAKDAARRAYVAEHLAGRAPLMMAASNELADEMNDAIRSDLQHLGEVQAGGPELELMNGARAGVGDLIVLREVHHDAESGEPGRGLANGDTLEITSIDGGRVTARRVLDVDAAGQRCYTRPFVFPYAAQSQLAYVVTGHRAQGRTVTAGIALFTGRESHEWAYPALTRGRDSNHAIVFTLAPNRADPREGTREAPELARWRRMQNERNATGKPRLPDPEAGDDALQEALGILSAVLERPERELAATQWKAQQARNADHLPRLYVEWQHLTGEANRARYEAQLREVLPETLRGVQLSGTAMWLWRSLRAVEAAGLDSAQVLRDALAKGPLTGARDVAAVVDSRIRKATAGLIPLVPRRWAERVPEVTDPVIRAYLERRAAQMDARIEREAAHVTATAPAWAVQAIGPVPEDPVERLEWQHRIAPVVAYRGMFGWEHETEPIGPEPTADTPEKRQAWHGAFAALAPARGLDLRHEPDSRLWLMMSTYATVTREAPRYVAGELRFIRVAARDFGLAAVRHAAEVKAARQRGDDAAAERHATREASARAMEERSRAMEARLTVQDEIYREHERATQYERLVPIAARAELVRRHPETDIPLLRSAEPEPPSKAERAQLLWPRLDPEGQLSPETEATAAAARGTPAPLPEPVPEPRPAPEAARAFARWLDGAQPAAAQAETVQEPHEATFEAGQAAARWLDKPTVEVESPGAGKELAPAATEAGAAMGRWLAQRQARPEAAPTEPESLEAASEAGRTFGRWLDGVQQEPEAAGSGPEPAKSEAAAAFARWLDGGREQKTGDAGQEAGPEEREHEAPAWVQENEHHGREVQEKLAERETQKVPDEDHEREDIGSAWPGVAEHERDAILQPAKPDLQPAPEAAGRAAEPERAYAEAEAQAGG